MMMMVHVLPSFGYYQTVLETCWFLNPKRGHRRLRDNSSSLCGTVPVELAFVPGGPKPSLSSGAYRDRALTFLWEGLADAYNHA